MRPNEGRGRSGWWAAAATPVLGAAALFWWSGNPALTDDRTQVAGIAAISMTVISVGFLGAALIGVERWFLLRRQPPSPVAISPCSFAWTREMTLPCSFSSPIPFALLWCAATRARANGFRKRVRWRNPWTSPCTRCGNCGFDRACRGRSRTYEPALLGFLLIPALLIALGRWGVTADRTGLWAPTGCAPDRSRAR